MEECLWTIVFLLQNKIVVMLIRKHLSIIYEIHSIEIS